MSELPMPSEVRALAVKELGDAAQPSGAQGGNRGAGAVVEPPSIKLILRLFIIPLLIAAAVVGIMLPIAYMVGTPSLDSAMERLKNPGGERTMSMVGPGAKQRYMDAKTLVDHMKSGLDEGQRIRLANQLVELLEKHVRPEEGEVQHFVLLALGRVWQKDPHQAEMKSPAAEALCTASSNSPA